VGSVSPRCHCTGSLSAIAACFVQSHLTCVHVWPAARRTLSPRERS
jgi:hypothetical protein